MPETSFATLIETWWGNRTEEQRNILKEAAAENSEPLDPAIAKLLLDTRCPFPQVGSAWAGQDLTWHWNETVRQFVLAN
ncbi:hypothetical protein ACLQ3K_16085 [Tsukamurella sp. DT100]|uniref:hypothetical protein n=1 Tax=Tsukamurella sp. DT100 TaxID=3393415 RepID=UPI003CF556A5